MASPTTAVNFLEVACKSGLLTQKQLDELFATSVPSDPTQCASLLIKNELLTPYQAKQLLLGKFRGFFLGPYKILRPIGQGGMGAVYLAEHTSLGRKVAIKVLTAEKAKDKLTLERFNREARAAAALDHPNIVRLHDISQGAGVHFLVMEYVEGNDLQSLMAQTGPLHYAQAAQYVAQAAAGLQHAHDKGFIHRDIKPANLILTKDGGIKILDMGLARSFVNGNDNITALLADGDIAGTVDFLSPEQAMNHPLDERSDIYSLGATFYALVTGHPPFNGSTAQKLMQHQMKEPPSVTKKLNGRVPPALSEVISKMMTKRTSERFQSATEVVDALGPWLPAVSTGNIVQDPMTLSEFRMPTGVNTRTPAPKGQLTNVGLKPVWKRPPVLIGVGVGLLLLVGGLILALTLGGGKTPDSGARLTEVPSYGPPQQQSANNPKPTPTAVKSVPPRAGGKSLYTVDFTTTPPVSRTVQAGGRSIILTELSGTSLPPGVVFNHWNPQTSAVYSVGDRGGVRALGLQPTGGNDGVQAHFKCDGLFTALAPGGVAKARVTYALDGTKPANAFFELRVEPYAKYETVALPVTGGQWRTVDLTFTRPADTGEYELVVRAGEDRTAVDGTLWVKSVEAFDPAVPTPAVVYRLDASKLRPFRKRIDFDLSFSGANIRDEVPGWQYEVYDKESDGEAAAELDDGKVALAIGSRAGKNAAQYTFQPVKVGSTAALAAGREYEARVEYKTDGGAAGNVGVQTINEWKIIGGASLPPTDTWRTVSFPVTRPEGKEVQFTFGTAALGTGFLKIRSFEIVDPSATAGAATPSAPVPVPVAPVAPVGRSVAAFDLNGIAPFKKTFQDGASGDGATAIAVNDAIYGTCWKKESVAEFRCETVDGHLAVGVTNLNETVSSQIGVGLKTAELKGRKKYVARVEYLTRNDAAGDWVVQRQDDYRRLGTARLNGTNGKWATADVTFDAPADATVVALAENVAVGEGNTLLVRRVDVFEAK